MYCRASRSSARERASGADFGFTCAAHLTPETNNPSRRSIRHLDTRGRLYFDILFCTDNRPHKNGSYKNDTKVSSSPDLLEAGNQYLPSVRKRYFTVSACANRFSKTFPSIDEREHGAESKTDFAKCCYTKRHYSGKNSARRAPAVLCYSEKSKRPSFRHTQVRTKTAG